MPFIDPLTKAEHRILLKKKRYAASVQSPNAGKTLYKKIPLEFWETYKKVAFYYPVGTEISTLPLIQKVNEAYSHIITGLPFIKNDSLVFKQWRFDDKLFSNVLNIPQPPEDYPNFHPDLMIVPLLGCDKTGTRLGYGGGFYDKTLAALHPRPYLLGAGFTEQYISHLPCQNHDVKMDAFICPTAFHEF